MTVFSLVDNKKVKLVKRSLRCSIAVKKSNHLSTNFNRLCLRPIRLSTIVQKLCCEDENLIIPLHQ